jgi:hypothetical protein
MGVIDAASWAPGLLKARQRQLLETLADAWDIGRDSAGTNLALLSEAELASPAESSRGAARTSRRVTLPDLLTAGLLEVEMELVWKRPRVGEVHRSSVTALGQIRLEDGRQFDTPSCAAPEAAGSDTQDGWEAGTLPDGRKIGTLWHEYQLIVRGDSDCIAEPMLPSN